MLLRYFARLRPGKLVLWCYLCWYITIVFLFMDSSPALWLSSLGMSAIIGTALVLSTVSRTHRPDGWAIFRLYLMPFCVSSYSALIKGQGFWLIFPPFPSANLAALSVRGVFIVLHLGLKKIYPESVTVSAGKTVG